MIYIDASRYSNTGKRTGVENYSYHLINQITTSHNKEVTLISPRKINLDAPQIIIPFPRLWTLLRLSWEIWRHPEIDNLFVPSHVLPLIQPKRTTITIHDVVFKYSPKSYSLASRLYLNWATKYAVKKATIIITPSEATKKDLLKFYKADPTKINVVPLGYEPAKKEAPKAAKILKKFNLQTKKYFLFIGRIEYKKNTDTLIKAYEEFAKTNQEINLVLSGFPGHGGAQIIDSIPSDLRKRVILTDYIKEEEKWALLENTLCFIFPSRFEGFGIPLLEAMEAKVPIIASDIPSSREVAGNKIHFFPKDEVRTLTSLMREIEKNPRLDHDTLIDYEKKVKKFSWDTCAKVTFDLIKAK